MTDLLRRRASKCEECPYKPRVSTLTDAELSNALCVSNQDFPCHMEDGANGWAGGCAGISCRGHWEAVKMAEKKGLPAVPMDAPEQFDAALPANLEAPVE